MGFAEQFYVPFIQQQRGMIVYVEIFPFELDSEGQHYFAPGLAARYQLPHSPTTDFNPEMVLKQNKRIPLNFTVSFVFDRPFRCATPIVDRVQ